MRILIAGIGNIFFGDDAFGCEVVSELIRKPFPQEVRIVDFGIRGYDLAYAILEGYDTVILIDAAARGETPGTTALLELRRDDWITGEASVPDPHGLDAVRVLEMVRAAGGNLEKVYLLACEPAVLETDDFGLSPPVQAALPHAVELIERFVCDLLQNGGLDDGDRKPENGELVCAAQINQRHT